MAENKKPYVCAICGADYDSPLERAHCEIACEAKKAEAAERERQAKLEQEMSRRKKEILIGFDALKTKCSKFSEEYGVDVSVSLNWSTDTREADGCCVPESIWSLFYR